MRRVLHIVSGMDRGGIETWIMNVLRRLDLASVRFDFLVETEQPAAYDAEILSSGGRISRSPRFRHRGRAAARLYQVLRGERYDVVHAHGRHDMGWPLSVARVAGVPVRIGHVHNVKDSHNANPVQRGYKRVMKRVLWENATWVLGCSNAALASLYGADAVGTKAKLAMLPYGIDVQAFRRRRSREDIERELSIPSGSWIVGHVGRFVWEKNHGFLLRVFADLARRDPRWYLVLVGDGRLRTEIEAQAATLGVRERVRMTGVRSDVPELVSAMDVFLFPSHIEGFGLVIVEAQALAVPCVLGRHLPDELDVHAPIVHRVPLASDAAAVHAWADAAERARDSLETDPDQRRARIAAAHEQVARSHFNIARSVATLLERYYGFHETR